SLQPLPALRTAEVLDPEDLVAAGVLSEGEAEPDVVEDGGQQVVPMGLAFHPAVHDFFYGVLSARDVLAGVAGAVAGRLDAVHGALAFRRVVGVVAPREHVARVRLSRVVQPGLAAQRSEAAAGPLAVDAGEHLPAHALEVGEGRRLFPKEVFPRQS